MTKRVSLDYLRFCKAMPVEVTLKWLSLTAIYARGWKKVYSNNQMVTKSGHAKIPFLKKLIEEMGYKMEYDHEKEKWSMYKLQEV
jgi:hypothetical protein